MPEQSNLPRPVRARRIGLKRRIYELFANNLGRKFDSKELHKTFGGALRARLSDIRVDPKSEIEIRNFQETLRDGTIVSWYVAESKPRAEKEEM